MKLPRSVALRGTCELINNYFDSVLGAHSNMCAVLSSKVLLKTVLYAIAPSLMVSIEDEGRMYPLKPKLLRHVEETGYLHIQATKPDTVGTYKRAKIKDEGNNVIFGIINRHINFELIIMELLHFLYIIAFSELLRE